MLEILIENYWKSGIYEAITVVTTPSRNQEFQYSQKQTPFFIFDMGNYDFLSKQDPYFKTFHFLDRPKLCKINNG